MNESGFSGYVPGSSAVEASFDVRNYTCGKSYLLQMQLSEYYDFLMRSMGANVSCNSARCKVACLLTKTSRKVWLISVRYVVDSALDERSVVHVSSRSGDRSAVFFQSVQRTLNSSVEQLISLALSLCLERADDSDHLHRSSTTTLCYLQLLLQSVSLTEFNKK